MVARASNAALAALVLGAVSLIPPAAAGAGGRSAEARYRPIRAVPGEVLIRYRRGLDRRERAAIRRAADVRLEERLPLSRLELVRTARGWGVGKAVAELEDLPGVAYAEPNFRYRIDALIPDDSLFGQQWGMTKIDAPEAWDSGTGSTDVVVAVLDTGLEYEHPDLNDNVWLNPGEIPDTLDNDGNGFVDDQAGWDFVGDDVSEDNDPRDANGHGSHVAGILGAKGNNGVGVAGVNWDVSIMPLRVCDAGGSCDSADVVEAIDYAGDMGADVANMSFSGGSFSLAQKNAIDAAADTLFVTSAGNSGTNNDSTPQYPCAYNLAHLICVAASTQNDGRWPNSNFGPTSVDLTAPGDDVLSTFPVFDTTVFTDDFEGPAKWDFLEAPATSPTQWERTTEHTNPARNMTDSHDGAYGPNGNVAASVTSSWDLTDRNGCSIRYQLRLDTQPSVDWLLVEGGSGFQELDRWSGSTLGGFTLLTSDLGDFEDQAVVPFRFRLTSDDSDQRDGAHVDDVTVQCLKPVASWMAGDGYVQLEGTSMAAPHVAGTAALLRSEKPSATVTELKAAILGSVDPVSAFAGITVTGGRLNANRALAFLTDVSPPAAPVPVAPGDGSVVTTATPTFTWQASSDPESGVARYQLFVDGSLNREVSAVSTSTTPVGELSEGPHTWSVRAVNGVGLTADSPTKSFTADPAQTHDRTVSLKLRKHLIARGSLVTEDGFAGCLQGATVKIQRKRGGPWRTMETLTPKSSGAYRARLKDRPGRYRASVSETIVGNDVCGAGVSPSVRHRH
jgi:subtilisin family serine protease